MLRADILPHEGMHWFLYQVILLTPTIVVGVCFLDDEDHEFFYLHVEFTQILSIYVEFT